VQTYISNNPLTTFTLYNILDTCTKSITIYHNKYNAFHGNTTVQNFRIQNIDLGICLCNPTKPPKSQPGLKLYHLTNHTKFMDYEILFISFDDTLKNKNKHFSKILGLYRTSFYKSIF
jgi:hypothetical protein